MKGSQKSKRVSWATNGNLCQVKTFKSDDYPWKIRIGTVTNLEPKMKSAVSHNTKGSVLKPDDSLPPGFEGAMPKTNKLLVQAKWRCPPKIELDCSWRVACGEESEEVQTQNERESRLLEAVYPRPCDIPPNPVVSLDARITDIDDSKTPLIPMSPIEDEETREVVDCVQPQLLDTTTTSDALSAMLKSNFGQEKLIDHELLVKLLTNPAALEKQLVKLQGNQNMTLMSKTPIHPTEPKTPSYTVTSKNLTHPSKPNDMPSLQYQPTPAMKDMNYYRSLIQQHGVQKQQDEFTSYNQTGLNPNPAIITSVDTKKSKPKFNKPCVYFKTSKGCKNGDNCLYQHDSSFLKRANSVLQMQPAKRMKIDRVITAGSQYMFKMF